MKLLVYGSSEYARLVREIAVEGGHEFVGFIDDFSTGGDILGPFEEVFKTHPPSVCGIALGIGYKDVVARWAVCEKITQAGYSAPTLVHERAFIDRSAQVCDGVIVMAGAVIDKFSKVDSFCVVWPGAVISHDSVVGSNTFVSPNATVCGFVNVGRNCFLGAGAVVVDHRIVPDGAFVKAGTVYK